MTTRPTEDELEAWIEECVAHLRDAEGFDVISPHANEFLQLYGVIARTIRYADAYLVLSRAGYPSEAVACAGALDHAPVGLHCAGRCRAFSSHRPAHDRIKHYSNLADWQKSDALAEELTKLDSPPKGKRLPPFMDIVRSLDQEKFLESSYHVLSQQVHVTHAAVTSFITPGEDGELHIQYDQNGFIDPVQQWAPQDASPSGIAITDDAILIANLRGERLREVPLADPTTSIEHLVGEDGRLRDVILAPDGSTWVVTNNTDGRGDPGRGDDRIFRFEMPR